MSVSFDGLINELQRPSDEEFNKARCALYSLEPRHFQVFLGFIRGQSAKQTARDLGLEVNTVGCYRTEARKKLGCRDSIDMAMLAARAGLK